MWRELLREDLQYAQWSRLDINERGPEENTTILEDALKALGIPTKRLNGKSLLIGSGIQHVHYRLYDRPVREESKIDAQCISIWQPPGGVAFGTYTSQNSRNMLEVSAITHDALARAIPVEYIAEREGTEILYPIEQEILAKRKVALARPGMVKAIGEITGYTVGWLTHYLQHSPIDWWFRWEQPNGKYTLLVDPSTCIYTGNEGLNAPWCAYLSKSGEDETLFVFGFVARDPYPSSSMGHYSYEKLPTETRIKIAPIIAREIGL